ncbi:MAG TPA: preprotein translocase subunit TatB [Oxalicibacterium sp.]|uniref:preprotein translocase subunit TatB n=1 Tax=Oxalicibacterium sp. TaxID=2766525 RepID=UPI002C2D2A95|nr:preprotein translocase subunit TatB [Oxalicibacterium sp.]HWU99064.1 preprotein translocase subunit TatB [Oxalicibacterium sp.]
MKISFSRICAVWRRFRRGALRHHTDHARYLPQIESLMRRADPNARWHARANWMIDLADWIRREPKVSLLGNDKWRRVKHQRIRFLLDWLDAHRDVKQNVQATLRKTLREATGHELFSATGMPRESAFFSELSERIAKLILPRPVGQQDLSTLFTAMFPDESDAAWLMDLDNKTLSRLWKLGGDDGIAHGYRQQIDEAMLYLVTMVISVGISPAFRQRLEPRMPLLATPFMALRRELENCLMTNTRDEAAMRSVRMLIAVCQAQTDKIYAHLDEYGVSVGLVYHVERMRAQLTRIARLLDLRMAPSAEQGSGQVQMVLADLMVAHHHRSSVRELLSRSFALLARKMVERNADHGELHIARNKGEYKTIWKAALLGGVVVAFTSLAKLGIGSLGLANFFEGLFQSIVFAVSFLFISAIGGVLSTRQPAVTAPALAAKTGELDTIDGLRALLARATALLRAQSAAIFGNLMTALPIMAVLAAAMLLIFDRPLINAEKAHATIHSLSLLGLTPLFAAATGVLLWLASLFAGFTDNWFTLRRLRESLAHHRRLVHALGTHRAERLASWLERNVAAIAGNLALAVLLGMAPVIAQFFGVPLDVRHVALSAAALTAAAGSLGWDVVTMPQFWLACAGVVSIGLLNVGIAFACALALALRARDVPKRTRRLVFRAVLQRFALRPAVFFWPVAVENVAAALPDEEEVLLQAEGEEMPGKGDEQS